MKKAAIEILAIYILLAAGLFIFQRKLIYFPKPIEEGQGIPGEVWIDVPEVGRISGTYSPASPEGLTILFFHGNAGNVLYFEGIASGLRNLGAGLLEIDYPGYGRSEGSPCEESLYASAHAAAKFLNEKGIENEKIVIFGFSLGTGVAVEMASSGEFAGLILQAPFTDIASVGQAHFWFLPVSLFLMEKYDSLSLIEEVGCPKLFIIGTADKLIANANSMELFEAARPPKEILTVEGAGHNEIQSVGGEDYWNAIRQWMETIQIAADK